MIPHALHNQPAFQHMGTPSASPPMPNGAFHHMHHHGTPQPGSRPSSRAHVRHPSQPNPGSIPPQQIHASQPPLAQSSYAYKPQPGIYNPDHAAAMQARSQPPQIQFHQYTSVPQTSQPPAQMYQQEQPRSIPSGQTPPLQQQRDEKPTIQVPSPEPQQSQFSSPPLPQPKALPAGRTHSIFTPIDDNRSMLMRHWAVSETPSDQKSDSGKEKDAKDPPRSQTLEVNHMMRSQMNGNMVNVKQNQAPTSNPPPRTNSTPTLPSITPLGRTNSITDPKRPRLKVQIPIDHSDDEANTGTGVDMSDSRSNVLTPIRDPGLTPGPVLPPPSPSAPALLSAGASGPPNPFARPLHPGANGSQRNGDGRGDMDTPISALPSRFMSDNLLPSPSSFYNEWGFGRGGTSSGFGGGGAGSAGGGAGEGSSAGGAGNGSNLLPSPLTFQTPVNATGPSFRDAAGDDAKRKLGEEEVAGAKRIKT